MRNPILALTGLVLFAGVASAQEAGLALTGATVIDGTGGEAIDNAVVLVEDGRLGCVGTTAECPLPDPVDVVDFSGHFIAPGLIDAHVHFAQTGWLDGRPDGVRAPDIYPYEETIAALRANPGRWHASYLCSGITAVFDVGGQDWTVANAHAVDVDRPDRVHVQAAGPLITHAGRNEYFVVGGAADQPLFLPMDSDEAALDGVAHLAELGAAAVKVWYLDPPAERRESLDARLMRVGESAREAGLPLIVHATELRSAKAALRAGASMLVHSVEDKPIDREFLELLLDNGAVYAPTLLVSRNWGRALASVAVEQAVTVDDPNRCVDAAILDRIDSPERLTPTLSEWWTTERIFSRLENAGRGMAQMYANLRAVHEAGGRIATATDAGNPLTVHGPSIHQEMEAMEAAGLPPAVIIEMSTRGGAVAMGRLSEFGTLEAGKAADLIVLAEDPRETVRNFRSLTHVMRAGKLATQQALRVR